MKHDDPEVTTETIWRELSDRLRQFIRSRISSTADVDDVLQSVFVRILEHLGELRKVERVQSWVFQIARNAIADHFRRRPDEECDVAAIEDRPERADNANKELAGCVSALIEHLPDDQRRAVSMYELEGISQQVIADSEGISLSGAKSRIQRGRKNLESLLRACCQFQFDARGNVLEYKRDIDGCKQNCDCDCP